MSIIYTGDWHLGISDKKDIEVVKQISLIGRYAEKNKIKKIKITGDILDDSFPEPGVTKKLIEIFNEWDKKFEVDYVPGNHEWGKGNRNSLSPIKEIEYNNIRGHFEIENVLEDDFNYIYIPHIPKTNFSIEENSEENVKEFLNEEIKKRILKNKKNIVIGHIHAMGSIIGAEQKRMKGGINFFDFDGKIDLCVLGHIHSHQIISKKNFEIVYTGSLIKTDFGEEGQKKGFVVIDENLNKKFVKLESIEYKTIDYFPKKTFDFNSVMDCIVKLRIHVRKEERKGIDIPDLLNKFKNCEIQSHELIYDDSEKKEVENKREDFSDEEILKEYIDDSEFENKKAIQKKAKEILNSVSKNGEKVSGEKITIGKLKLKNFRSFEEVEIDLSDFRTCGIIGKYEGEGERSNGAGKSTVLNSIPWIIFGKYLELSDDELLTHGKKGELFGSVELKTETETYIIERMKKGSKSDLRFYSEKNDYTGQIRETQAEINKLISMDYELFTNSVFFTEKDQEGFCRSTPTERKEVLKKILNLSVWDNCLEMVKEESRDVEREVSQLKYHVDQIEIVNEEELSEKIKNTETLLTEKKKEKLKLEKNFEEIKKGFELSESLEDQKLKLEDELDSEKRKKNESEKMLEKNSDKIKSLEMELKKSGIVDIIERDIEKFSNSILEDSKELEGVKTKGIAIKESLEKIKKIGSVCPTCGQSVKTDPKKVKEMEGELESLRSYYEEIEKRVTLNKVEKAKLGDKLSKSRETVREIEKIENSVPFYDKTVIESGEKLKKLKKELENVEKNLSAIDKKSKKEYNDIKFLLERMGEEILELSGDLGAMRKEMESIEKNKKEIERITKEIDLETRELLILESLKTVFGKNGVILKRIGKAIDFISEESNNIFKKIIPEGEIFFETLKENKSGKISESLDIFIEVAGVKRRYETFSGGESTIANLSIRLAISELIGQSGKMLSVFLDEVFGRLDKRNREAVLEIVGYLKERFKSVFVVSHTEIKDFFEDVLIVEKSKKTGLSFIK